MSYPDTEGAMAALQEALEPLKCQHPVKYEIINQLLNMVQLGTICWGSVVVKTHIF